MKKTIKNLNMAIILIVITLTSSCIHNKKDSGTGKTPDDMASESTQNALPLEPVDMQRVMQITAMLPDKPRRKTAALPFSLRVKVRHLPPPLETRCLPPLPLLFWKTGHPELPRIR